MIFTAHEIILLANEIFREDYAGFKGDVREAPNGDGKVDFGKVYAHVASKYGFTPTTLWFYHRAWEEACRVHDALDLPRDLRPSFRHSALRLLQYPPGHGSHEHTDFDLFTILCFRDPDPGGLYLGQPRPPAFVHDVSPHCHFGEMLEVRDPSSPATPHEVYPMASNQVSCVFFAIPDHDAELRPGLTVGAWLDERIARSRVQIPKKKVDPNAN